MNIFYGALGSYPESYPLFFSLGNFFSGLIRPARDQIPPGRTRPPRGGPTMPVPGPQGGQARRPVEPGREPEAAAWSRLGRRAGPGRGRGLPPRRVAWSRRGRAGRASGPQEAREDRPGRAEGRRACRAKPPGRAHGALRPPGPRILPKPPPVDAPPAGRRRPEARGSARTRPGFGGMHLSRDRPKTRPRSSSRAVWRLAGRRGGKIGPARGPQVGRGGKDEGRKLSPPAHSSPVRAARSAP